MANKQSHLSTGQGPLQHFIHLFQFAACLTSAGWILLTQVYVSWPGIGSLPRHKGTLPPPPPPPPLHASPLWRLEKVSRRREGGTEKQEEMRRKTSFCAFSLCMRDIRKLPQLGCRQQILTHWYLHLHLFLSVSLFHFLPLFISLHLFSLVLAMHSHSGGQC